MSNSSRKRTMHDDSDHTTSTRSKAHKAPKQQSLGAFFSTKKGKTSETMTDDVQWREIGNTWIGKWGSPTAASKFAAFDLDFTLVNVAGKGRFPRNSDDWRFFHPDIPQVLRKMHQQGYRIVILSNQNGLQPGKKDVGLSKKATEYRLKISKIAKQLDVPFTILAAIAKDHMRKPSPGMWHLAQMENEGVDVENSFFVGDAAGRPAGWKSG
ncbi:DNA kinase/phosphatase Pnk1, partial [Coemansia sp. RSA 475]